MIVTTSSFGRGSIIDLLTGSTGSNLDYNLELNGNPNTKLCKSASSGTFDLVISEKNGKNVWFSNNVRIVISVPTGYKINSAYDYNVANVDTDNTDTDFEKSNIDVYHTPSAIFITFKNVSSDHQDKLTISGLEITAESPSASGAMSIFIEKDLDSQTFDNLTELSFTTPEAYIYASTTSVDNRFAPNETFNIVVNAPDKDKAKHSLVIEDGSNQDVTSNFTVDFNNGIYTVTCPEDAGTYSLKVSYEDDGCKASASPIAFSIVIPSIFHVESISGPDLDPTYCEDEGTFKVYFDPDEIYSGSTTGTVVEVFGQTVDLFDINGNPYSELGDAYFNINLADYPIDTIAISAYRTYSSISQGDCENLCFNSYDDCRRTCDIKYPDIIIKDPILYPTDPFYQPLGSPKTFGSSNQSGKVAPQFSTTIPLPKAVTDQAYATYYNPDRDVCYNDCEQELNYCITTCSSSTAEKQTPPRKASFTIVAKPAVSVSFAPEYCDESSNINLGELVSPNDGYGTITILSDTTDITSTAINSAQQFVPSALNPGTYSVVLEYDNGVCIETANDSFTVTSSPDFGLSVVNSTDTTSLAGFAVCESEAALTIMENDGSGNLIAADISNMIITYAADTVNPANILVETNGQVTLDPTQLDPGFTYSVGYTKASGSCSASRSFPITINPNPTPFFTGLRTEYCEADPSKIELKLNPEPKTNTVDLQIFNLSGDDVTSTYAAITQDTVGDYYFEPRLLPADTYIVRYSFTNGNTGCTGIFESDEVTIFPSPDSTYTVENFCLGQTTLFTATEPEAADSSTTYVWEFGDGTVQRGRTVSKKFAVAGFQTVTFTITNAGGCSFTTKKNVAIYPLPVMDYTSYGYCENNPTTFDATVAANADAADTSYSIDRYIWDYGDGVTDTLDASTPIAEHVYTSTGKKVVTLTIETAKGCGDQLTREIFIFPVISAELYREQFEAGYSPEANGWLNSHILDSLGLSSWRLEQIDSVGMAWTTRDNSGTYFNNEKSYLESACIDMSVYDDPQMNLYYECDTDNGNDGAVVLYSTDGGIDWVVLGDGPDGVGWYNTDNLLGQPGEEFNASRKGWSGSDTGWTVGKYPLAEVSAAAASGNGLVRFRLAFGSNTDNPIDAIFGGFSLDEVRVFNKNKLVLLEHFTNLTDAGAKAEREALMTYDESRDDVVKIQYHIPDPVEDEVYLSHNPQVHGVPWLTYGISGPGVTVVEGRYNSPVNFTDGWGPTATTFHSLESTPFELATTYTGGRNGDPLQISVDVIYNGTIINSDTAINQRLSLKTAVVMETMTESGETMRKVFYDFVSPATGVYIDGPWEPGIDRTDNVTMEWAPPHTAEASTFSLVSWLQFTDIQYYDEYNHPIRPVLQSAYLPVAQPVDATRVTGIADDMASEEIGLYPNPARDVVALTFPYPTIQPYEVSLIDMTGKTHGHYVVPGGSRAYELQISQLPRGLYLVRIYDNKGQQVVKKLLLR
ncbi:PKD domain-containing protein [Roseivirga sp. BDSF3-8]|uniref:T9SS type A sorting domain-containing protein n=1 Tax=Roseivirga sp. BDSF3-8 TaxID=3241598 RepID=UPI003531C083